jgi:acid phosphatase family membrane protein YuiD
MASPAAILSVLVKAEGIAKTNAQLQGLHGGLGKSSKAADRLGTDLDKSTRTGSKALAGLKSAAGLAGLAVGAAGLAGAVKDSIGEYREAQKVGAQTNAVIKSTGGAANVSAKHVGDLATAISKKAGIDDEAIQSGSNLLLTFKGVRNETGKGNDIFDQATQTITDMSVSLKQGLKPSAIQVGKALNDPVKGITALGRVGVQFTEGQKKMIAGLVKSGDTLGAQKIILKRTQVRVRRVGCGCRDGRRSPSSVVQESRGGAGLGAGPDDRQGRDGPVGPVRSDGAEQGDRRRDGLHVQVIGRCDRRGRRRDFGHRFRVQAESRVGGAARCCRRGADGRAHRVQDDRRGHHGGDEGDGRRRRCFSTSRWTRTRSCWSSPRLRARRGPLRSPIRSRRRSATSSTRVWGVIKTVTGAVWDFLTSLADLPGKLWAAGKAITEGVINGIKALPGLLLDAAKWLLATSSRAPSRHTWASTRLSAAGSSIASSTGSRS